MQILITGANGFIGKNLQLFLKEQEGVIIDKYTSDNSPSELEPKIQSANFIIHLAGVNRPQTTEEFFSGNTDLTKKIIDLLNKNNLHIPLIFSSSIQAELDNDYGKSKRLAEDYILDNYKEGIIFRLHNVFGKWCRPNYNSVVATFCNNIANNIPIQIDNPDKKISLIYIDDICKTFIKIINGNYKKKAKYHQIEPVYDITLQNLANMIKGFKENLSSLSVPATNDDFTRKLFSTYISYNTLENLKLTPKTHQDERGTFTELIHMPDSGQVSFSVSHPGITRGNHYHQTKVEKFIVIEGEAVIKLRKIGETKIHTISVSGNKPQIITIPVGYTHNITNTGNKDMLLLMWCNEIFDNNNPDTFFEEV